MLKINYVLFSSTYPYRLITRSSAVAETATHRVNKFFAKSLKLTQGHTVFELLDVKQYRIRDLEIWVSGHSRSFKIVPFENVVCGFLFALH